MKKAALATALLILASAAFAQAPHPFFKGTLDEALAKAKAEGKKLLLDFNSYT
jgi:hypothetical protein